MAGTPLGEEPRHDSFRTGPAVWGTSGRGGHTGHPVWGTLDRAGTEPGPNVIKTFMSVSY
jgi:hypothetical protein